MNKMFSVLFILLFFGSTSLNAIENISLNYFNPPCDIQNNTSDGSCWCDSIVMYHSYLFVTGDRSVAIEAAVDYLEECNNGF